MASRQVVIHIHLFKNAGTSVEASLRGAFDEGWASYDGATAGSLILQPELEDYLRDRPDVVALSSHQVRPPLADNDAFTFLPIVFLRHPIDRIRSAYQFERQQGPVSPSSRVAADSSFADWIEFHESRGSVQCRNFQIYSLTSLRNDTRGVPFWKQPIDRHLESALEFLERVEPVGIVEHMAASMERLEHRIAASLPGFEWQTAFLNRSASQGSSLSDRLGKVAEELGDQRYSELVERNAADLELHIRFSAAYDRAPASQAQDGGHPR